MLVGVLPQVGLQALGQVAPEDLEQVFEYGFAGPDEEGEDRQNGDLFLGGFKPQARHEAFFLIDHHINSNTNQDFRGNVEQLVKYRAGGRGDELAPIASGIAQKSHQGCVTAGVLLERLTHGPLRLRQKRAKGSELNDTLK